MLKKRAINPLTIKNSCDTAEKILRHILVKEVNYHCEECGKPLTRFEVHHKDGCGLNWQRDNLMVLCVPCHKLITMHSGQGKQDKELSLDWGRGPSKLSFEYIQATYNNCHPRA